MALYAFCSTLAMHRRKAAATNESLEMVLVTPPHAVLRAVGGHSVPSQGPLHTGDQEKVCLHQYGWILPVFRVLDSGGSDPISDYTTAVWTGALSQWKTDPFSARLGLFCLNLLIKILSFSFQFIISRVYCPLFPTIILFTPNIFIYLKVYIRVLSPE